MFLHRIILSGMVLWLTIVLDGCFLNRAPIVWIHDVKPQFVCPGDNVTLSWNVSVGGGCLGDGCPSPVIVSISSDPLAVLGSPLSVRGRGEQVAGPITGHTSFTFSATGGEDRRDPATHNVDVVLPDRETDVPLNFASSCSGAAAVWRDVDLSIPEFRAEAVRLVSVCNTSSHQISLTLTFESGTQVWTLFPGQCTEDLPPEVGSNVLAAHVSSLDLIGPPGARCDTSLSLPPDLNLTASLACDLMSASMPIVAATPAESDIIPLPSETPESVPFILVIQVPANCRQGPGTVYPVVNSALPGEQVQVIGKSADATWWYSKVDNDTCFISNIAGTPSGDLNLLTIVQAPPTPVPTMTPEQEQPEPTEKIIVDPDNDADGYPFSTDCNDKDPKINPGAVEMLKDNIDSNCNGDINK